MTWASRYFFNNYRHRQDSASKANTFPRGPRHAPHLRTSIHLPFYTQHLHRPSSTVLPGELAASWGRVMLPLLTLESCSLQEDRKGFNAASSNNLNEASGPVARPRMVLQLCSWIPQMSHYLYQYNVKSFKERWYYPRHAKYTSWMRLELLMRLPAKSFK